MLKKGLLFTAAMAAASDVGFERLWMTSLTEHKHEVQLATNGTVPRWLRGELD